MDILIIPIVLLLGSALVYFGVQGMPRLTAGQIRTEAMPFSLMEWLRQRPERPGANRTRVDHDLELVELMNEMIAVREELSGLKLAMSGVPIRRPAARARNEARAIHPEPKRQPYSGSNRRYVRT